MIHVTLSSRIYKGEQGPPQNQDHQINIKAIQTIIQDVGHYAYCGLNLSKSCVVGTFVFLISAHPNPKPTTLGIPLGGQSDKTRHIHLSLIKSSLLHVQDHLCISPAPAYARTCNTCGT
jgi:hypothetical protein